MLPGPHPTAARVTSLQKPHHTLSVFSVHIITGLPTSALLPNEEPLFTDLPVQFPPKFSTPRAPVVSHTNLIYSFPEGKEKSCHSGVSHHTAGPPGPCPHLCLGPLRTLCWAGTQHQLQNPHAPDSPWLIPNQSPRAGDGVGRSLPR